MKPWKICPDCGEGVSRRKFLRVSPVGEELRVGPWMKIRAVWIELPPITLNDNPWLITIMDKLWRSPFLRDVGSGPRAFW